MARAAANAKAAVWIRIVLISLIVCSDKNVPSTGVPKALATCCRYVLLHRTTFYYCAAQVGKSTKSHTRSRHPTRTLFDRLIVTARKSLGRMFDQRME
jgi:hypothetical protein